MTMYILLAWRNLWRNSHRTIITVSSILFAVILVLFTRSMQLGSYEHIITNTLSVYTGFIQVHGHGYWDERYLENSMFLSDSLTQQISDIEHVTAVVPRIETFALASSGEKTRGVTVTGIDPEIENRMNRLSEKLIKGNYIKSGSMGVLVAKELARHLGTSPGDSVVLLSQGYHGTNAAGLYYINGIVDLPVPDLNESMMYMSLDAAQYFLFMQGRVTSVAVMIDDPDNLNTVESKIQDSLGKQYEIMNWREMVPELVQSIEVDNAGGILTLGILYVVIGFGIFGTVMMMTEERKREFAILLAVGMKKWRIQLMIIIETLVIGLIGVISGIILTIPLLLYMKAHPIQLIGTAAEAMLKYGYEPIIPFLVEPSLFYNQLIAVVIIAIIASVYPIQAVSGLKISNTLNA
jgi:ABC-type lipoprotein release transport system permease subunit